MNLFLLLQYDPHDSYKELLPIGSSSTRQLQQYKHIWSCVSQYCDRFHRCHLLGFLQGVAAGIGTSNFLRTFFFKMFLQSFASISVSMHQTYVSTFLARHWSGLEVVCFLVTLSLNHVYPSGRLSSNEMNLVKPVHESDNSRSSSTFQQSSICFSNNTSSDVCVFLVTLMYFSGIGNDPPLGTYSLTLGSTRFREMNSPVIDQRSFLASASSRVESS